MTEYHSIVIDPTLVNTTCQTRLHVLDLQKILTRVASIERMCQSYLGFIQNSHVIRPIHEKDSPLSKYRQEQQLCFFL